ncbi:MAG TPA: hypothetical protein VNJ52_12330 [Patescibacteria group bacterium]|nr:hypothetical protein [Patescibacteria group bacterium]
MEHRDATRRGFDFLLHGSVDRAVLAIDRSLRRAKGIFEFCENDDCILRIGVIASETRILLPDGTQLLPKDPVIDLHFWNERMPSLVQAGSSLAWGAAFRTRMQSSLAFLAEYVASDPELKGVKACRARVAFLRDRRIQRAARHLGFVSAVPDQSLPGYVHEFLEVFLIYGLTWVFNPDALPHKACLPQRSYLWMSREELFRRYGASRSPDVAVVQAREKKSGVG